MTCRNCGREADVNGTQSHFIGCRGALGPRVAAKPEPILKPEPTAPVEDKCARDGCSNPRAVSKGPRPAKFCTDHKTNRSK